METDKEWAARWNARMKPLIDALQLKPGKHNVKLVKSGEPLTCGSLLENFKLTKGKVVTLAIREPKPPMMMHSVALYHEPTVSTSLDPEALAQLLRSVRLLEPLQTATDTQLAICAKGEGFDERTGLIFEFTTNGDRCARARKAVIRELRKRFTHVDYTNPNWVEPVSLA